MKLTKRSKRWIYYNIERWIKDDPYLSFLKADLILSDLKKQIDDNNYLKDLLACLDEAQFNQAFSFYRKDNKSFVYPSLKDQVESLYECWQEILDMFDEDFIDNEKIHGQKPNKSSHFNFKEAVSYKNQVLSCNYFVKKSFSKDYNKFKNKSVSTASDLVKEDKKTRSIVMIQTDIKSFFHSIDISKDILPNLPSKYSKSIKWLSTMNEMEKGLPIGWILSGFYATYILNRLGNELSTILKETVGELKIYALDYCMYVDDLILFVEVNKSEWEENQPKRKEIVSSILELVQNKIHSIFKSRRILLHDIDSNKTKFYNITKSSISILDSNFFDFNIGGSVSSEGEPQKWTALDEFLLPCDNDLELNDKIQFFENVKNLRTKVEQGEIRTYSKFKSYFDKILYKLEIDGKYLMSITDLVLRTYSEFNDKDKAKLIESFFNKLSQVELNIQNSLKVLSIFEKQNKTDKKLLDYEKKWINDLFKLELKRNNNFVDSHDIYLLDAWITQQEIFKKKQLRIYSSKKKLKINHTFYHKQFEILRDVFPSLVTSRSLNLKLCSNEFFYTSVLKQIFYSNEKHVDDYQSFYHAILKNSQREISFNVFKESFYFVISCMGQKDLERIYENFKDLKDPLIEELKLQLVNYQKHFDFFHGQDVCIIKKTRLLIKFIESFKSDKYSFQKPKCFYALTLTKNKKLYLFYREILVLLMFSSKSINEYLKLVFFQYVKIDSVVFFSWNYIPDTFSSLGLYSLSCLEQILSYKTSSFLEFEAEKKTKIIKVDSLIEKLKSAVSNSSSRKFTFDLSFFQESFIDKLIRIFGIKKQTKLFENKTLKLMISNIPVNVKKDFDGPNLSGEAIERINEKVKSAIKFAGRQNCNIICFPELTLPSKYLSNYFNEAAKYNLILIGGTEYLQVNSTQYLNTSVISFPVSKGKNPLGKPYLSFIQFKNYPSIKEIAEFREMSKAGKHFEVINGNGITIFRTDDVGDFSVLTCSDFLSLQLKSMLQGYVQTVFVPAMNFDNTTYHHVAQSAIRELYCYCVVVNNSLMGSSMVVAPFDKEYERTVFSIQGKSSPNNHIVNIEPGLIYDVQRLGEDQNLHFKDDVDSERCISNGQKKLGDFKQVPPDWAFIKKKVS